MRRNKEENQIHRMWMRVYNWLRNRNQMNVNQLFLIQRDEKRADDKNLRNPFPKSPKSPRVYKFYWSGY